jgi:hypothetical protein
VEILIGLLLMILIPAYPVLQIYALIRFRGVMLLLSLIPLPVIGFGLYWLDLGMRTDSNLAPLVLFLVTPPCALWLALLAALRR